MDQYVDAQPEVVSVPVDGKISRTTEPSRITGVQPRSGEIAMRGTMIRGLDWSALNASVVSGLAVTFMLDILGVSSGLISTSANSSTSDVQGILAGVGAWMVVAAIIGTLVGAFVGGRFARLLDRASLAYHALVSWGIATLATVLLASIISIGFVTAAATTATTVAATNNTPATAAATGTGAAPTTPASTSGQTATNNTKSAVANTSNGLGDAGWGLFVGMLLTLGTAVGGWWLGSRKPLTQIEQESPQSIQAS